MTQVVRPPITAQSPAQPGASFGGITRQPSPAPAQRNSPNFPAIQASPEFTTLRTRLRRFIFPMSALFFVWYLTYVLLAAYARDFMSHPLFGSVHVGLVLGLLQFVSTIAITIAYVRFTRNKIDPQVAAIRASAGVSDT